MRNQTEKSKFSALYKSTNSTKADLIKVIDHIMEVSFEVDEAFTPNYAIIPTIGCKIRKRRTTSECSAGDFNFSGKFGLSGKHRFYAKSPFTADTNNNFHATAIKNRNNSVSLSTVVVNVQGQKARFLLDSGSQVHRITHKCSKKLGLKISRCFAPVQGIGSNSNSVKGITDLIVASRYDSSKKYLMQAFFF
ncbi:hypothetical protein JTB14_022381 [Gonioctena quinquepunctata]|nr:hypothetical protein JTB14_022381 [Gonioctena quinquepunctata]